MGKEAEVSSPESLEFAKLMKIPADQRTGPEALRILGNLFWLVTHSSRTETEKLGDLCVVAGLAISVLYEVAREKEQTK